MPLNGFPEWVLLCSIYVYAEALDSISERRLAFISGESLSLARWK